MSSEDQKLQTLLNQQPKPILKTRRKRIRKPSHLTFSANQDGSTALQSMLQSLLTLYSMLILMLGVVVPISDALAKPVQHADYRQIFYLFIHAVGIVGIVYINTLISHYGSKEKRTRSEEDKKQTESAEVTTVTTVKYFSATYGCSGDTDTANAASSSTCQPSNEAGIEAASALVAQHSSRTCLSKSTASRSCSRVRRWKRVFKLKKHFNSNVVTPDEQSKIQWSGVGVNLYLRFGAIIFGFGVMSHTAFKIVDVLRLKDNERCIGPWFLPKHVVELLFIVLQTYFLFKHHKVTINTQRSLVRFFLVHLAVTNLCMWIKTVVYEIKAGLLHSTVKKLHKTMLAAVNFTASSYGQYSTSAKIANVTELLLGAQDRTLAARTVLGNSTRTLDNGTVVESPCLVRHAVDKESPSVKLGPYLYPCAVEYGLICAAICYKFFTNVGNADEAETAVGLHDRKPRNQPGAASELPRTTTCHKSHRGLFGGLIVTICVLVPMVSLLIAPQHANNEHRSLHIISMLIIECLVLVCTTIVALFGTVKAIQHLKLFKLERHEAFDVNLLFVGLAGTVCYSLFVVISVGACMMTSPTDEHSGCEWGGTRQAQVTQLTGLKALAELAESVAQTLYIMQAIQRRITRNLALNMKKPGRGITAAMLIANLAMWIASVFEFQRDVGQDFLDYYFGFMPWSIIQLILQPLIIFYRFHSTVCLSEIWVHSYKFADSHKKAAASLRSATTGPHGNA